MGWFGGDDKTEILQYTIHLTDAAKVAELQGKPQAGGAVGAVIMAPTAAAALYHAPLTGKDDPFLAPCITSAWFGGPDNLPTDKATFERDTGGLWGLPHFLFGGTTTYHWRGLFKYAPPLTGPTVPGEPVVNLMTARRWLDGFEFPYLGEGGSGNAAQAAGRAASRHLQGYGLKLDAQPLERAHHSTESGAAVTKFQWERFYLRIHRYGLTKARVWRGTTGAGSGHAAELGVSPDGHLILSGLDDAFDVGSLLSSSGGVIPLHVWHKVDVIMKGGAGASCTVYINGVLSLTGTPTQWSGNPGETFANSYIGNVAANTICFDVDDWVCAEIPLAGTGPTVYTSRDWNGGSRVAMVGATAFGSDHAAASWTGDWRLLRQRALTNLITQTQGLVSTNAGRLTIATDADREIDAGQNVLGIAALTVCALNSRGAGANGTLGYRLPGGAAVMAAITQITGNQQWNDAWFHGGGIQPLTPLAGLELLHDTTSTGGKVQFLGAAVEVIGVFGQEDVVPQPGIPPVATIPEKIGIHNSPYPRSQWAVRGTAPISPVVLHTGTYVGTGTFVDLRFRVPVHFLMIRSVTSAGVSTVNWFTSMTAAHIGGQRNYRSECPVDALMDPAYVPGLAVAVVVAPADIVTVVESEVRDRVRYWLKFYNVGGQGLEAYYMDAILLAPEPGHTPGWTADSYWKDKIAADPSAGLGYNDTTGSQEQQTIVRIVGTDGAQNALGTTYHYTAFCDPGMRFCQAGGLGITNGVNDYVHALDSETFTPEAGFVQQEDDGSAATVGYHYKGPGHAAGAISPADAAEITGLAFGLGTLTAKAGLLSSALAQIAYLVFRRDDGSGDPGLPRVLQLASYTGDGSASRTIGLSPLSGRRPVFAMVVPHNAGWYFRDAGHLGTTSTQFPAQGIASSGIMAGGIDSLAVGNLLNANGIVYDVFVFPGSVTAGNAGFSVDGEFIPVTPAGLNGQKPWDPTPPDPELSDIPIGGGSTEPGTGFVGGAGAADFGEQCVGPSTIIINQALSRLGVSKSVVDILTDQTQEAAAARLHYSEDVAATLRDFPWPFATRYATLALVAGAGSPDWTYAYRQPTDCVFERRIVVPRGAGIDPTPPPFQLSADDAGGLIYTNQPTAILEYTCRPPCAAGRGDALFREALCWRHALSLAPALSRMTEAAAAAEKMYELTLAKARLVLIPGKPGLPPAAPTIDVTVAMQDANARVVNRALVRIGAQTITDLVRDQSRGAVAARAIFEDELQATLRDFAWPFATSYTTPALVAGTTAIPVNGDWTYAYRIPADAIAVRRLVTVAQRRFEIAPPIFRLGRDATGPVLYTNEPSAVMEYTTRLEGAVLKADALFRDALAWRLAASLAPSLAQVAPEQVEQLGRGPADPQAPRDRQATGIQQRAAIARQAWQMYTATISVAERAAANEEQQDKAGDAEWITGRD